jgi:hypothetical protein
MVNIQLQLKPNAKQEFHARIAKFQFVVNRSFVNGDSRRVAEVAGKEEPLVANHGIGPDSVRLDPSQTITMSVDTQRASPAVQANPTSLRASTHGSVDVNLPFDVVAAYRRQLLDDNVRKLSS